MGYVSHIFMYMDIRKHINLVKNHGYEGKIGMIKKRRSWYCYVSC